MPSLMRNIMTGSARASPAMITIEELWSKRCQARGTATRASPASTTPRQTKRGKAAVPTTAESPTAAVRWVHTPIFKVTGRSRRTRGTIVRETRIVSVTWERREILIRANFPAGQAQTKRDRAEDIGRYSMIKPRRTGKQMDTGGLEQPAVHQ